MSDKEVKVKKPKKVAEASTESAEQSQEKVVDAEKKPAEEKEKSEAPTKVEPKIVLSKGKFDLWEVAGGFELRTNTQNGNSLCGKASTFEEGKKLISDMARN